MGIEFEINFDSPSASYQSGSLITGNVSLHLKEFLSLKVISMKFKGKAEVEWKDSDSDSSSGKNYKSNEEYFKTTINIFGTDDNPVEMELPAGDHQFPFRFQLPDGLPTSFDDSVGKVTYKAHCKIVKSTGTEKKVKKPFSVVGMLDLNIKPELRTGVSGNDSKYICCFCCKTGPITATFHIDKQGWVVGEKMDFHAEIVNNSDRTITQTYVELTMNVKFLAMGKSKKRKKEVACVRRPAIEAHGTDSWEGEFLIIPEEVPVSYLNGCRIIDIQYLLTLNVQPAGPALDLEIPLAITIGTIPFHPTGIVQQPSGVYGAMANPGIGMPANQSPYPPGVNPGIPANRSPYPPGVNPGMPANPSPYPQGPMPQPPHLFPQATPSAPPSCPPPAYSSL